MALINLAPLLLFLLLAFQPTHAARLTNPAKPPKSAVLLSTVQSLTLRGGKQTSSRRGPPVPQLQCVGPANICKLYSVDVMRCTNEGADYDKENVQWACKASLPEEFKLGATEVSCEGYESSEDPFVLKGSCGVEYKLMLTEKGEEKYGEQIGSGIKEPTVVAGKYLFILLFLGVAFIILRGWWTARNNNAGGAAGRRPPGGGGGGGGGYPPDDNDPPPPYDYPGRYYGTPKKSTPRANTGSRSSSTRTSDQPGFWTGAGVGGAAGTAAGYMFGRRNQTRTQPAPRQGGGGLFGGGGGGGNSWGTRPSSSTTASSSRTPSYSSNLHESSGFGGTSRR